MASLSHSHLADFYTLKASKEASSSIYNTPRSNIDHPHLQSLYSLMHKLHPQENPHTAPVPHLDHYPMKTPKPFLYGSGARGQLNKSRSVGGGEADELSFLSRSLASSTVTSPSIDDQVSSMQYHAAHKQAAMECKAPLSASSLLGGQLHVNAAKKRVRASMECKDVPEKDASNVKKRTKMDACEAYPRRNTNVIIQVKPSMTNAEKLKAGNPLIKQKSLPELKSPEYKSNVTKVSSSTLDQESPSKNDYIHVRARRGQATDSHSLAERVRREKISERMKYLQDLVPSCIKVTGKAMMLDEIINYVQSLQRQVEFLSMKLAAVPPNRLEFSFDNLFGNKAAQPSNVSGPSASILESGAAALATYMPQTDYANNIVQSSFANTFRGSGMFAESMRSHDDMNSNMRLQTSNQEIGMTCGAADQFLASFPSDLGVECDPLMHRSVVGSSSCSLVASPTDPMLDPVQQSCISQTSQLELEWDEDLHNIVQQMGCFTSEANSAWFPSDNLLTEGFFLQGNSKEEL